MILRSNTGGPAVASSSKERRGNKVAKNVLRSDHLAAKQDLGQPLGDHLIGAVRTGVWKDEQPATRWHDLSKYVAALELLEQHSASTRGAI